MLRTTRASVRARSLALWCSATAGGAGLAVVTVPAVTATPRLLTTGAGFTELLVAVCAAATLLATGWLWVIITDVVLRVLAAGRADHVVVRRPGAVRTLLLALCGVVVLSATTSPAHAEDRRPDPPHSLSGLPLPDRATGGATPLDEHQVRPSVHLVRPGDSLWAIAETRLGPRATVVDVVDYWHRIYDRNAALIGPDPDLILPGQRLDLPPTG